MPVELLRIEDLKALISKGNVDSTTKKQVLDNFVCPTDEDCSSFSPTEEFFNLTTELFWLKPIHDSIFVYCSYLKSEGRYLNEESLNKLFAIFGDFCNNDDKIVALIAEFVLYEGENQKRCLSLCAEQFLRVPDMVANIVGKNIGSVFHTDNYLSRLIQATVLFLRTTSFSQQPKPRFSILSGLIAKCIKGSRDLKNVISPLIDYGCQLNSVDYASKRRLWDIAKECSEGYMSTYVIAILKSCPSGKLVSCFLGDLVVQSEKCRRIFFEALLRDKHFAENSFVCNVIGYFLGPETSRLELFNQFVSEVCQLWSETFFVLYTSVNQILYVNKLLALAVLQHPNIAELGCDLNHVVMQGITVYLKSSLGKVRTLGSYVGQLVCNALNNNVKSRLDLPESTATKQIKKEIDDLMDRYKEQENYVQELESEIPSLDSVTISNSREKDVKSPYRRNSFKIDPNALQLDSDDDMFKPYDLSNDKPQVKFKQSLYLQDIITGLSGNGVSGSGGAAASKAADLFEQTITDAERIILCADQVAAEELCLEVSKVLLYAEDAYSTGGFETLRVNALTAILRRQHVKVSSYLTDMFYDPNLSIRHRLDILQAIRMGADQISCFTVDNKRVKDLDDGWSLTQSRRRPVWRCDVDVELLRKTRFYFSKKKEKAVENRFSPICGHFFFPLLSKHDQPIATLRLLKEDSQVFSNLLFTLGTVLYHSKNSPLVVKMVNQLLGEVCLKYLKHEDPSVRQAVWFCTIIAVVTLPSVKVIYEDEQLMQTFLKYRIAAKDVCQNDPHLECRDLARQVIFQFQVVSSQ